MDSSHNLQTYGIDIDMGSGASFNWYCKSHIYNHYKIAWREEVQNIDKNPILRNYKTYKSEFGMEPYLYLISNLSISKCFNQIKNQLAHLKNWTWPLYYS